MTTISQIELEKIPTARDPWAIVTQTPGVLSDRINVGGNESGQQSVFIAPATTDDENSFAVDGVIVTDMEAVGSSPSYYDFDQFDEIQVSTGGSDIEKSVDGGFQLQSKGGTFPGDVPLENEALLDVDGIWKNSYFSGISDRNSETWQIDGSYFFNTGALSHEIASGASYRKFEVNAPFAFPGRNVAHLTCESLGTCGFFTPQGFVGDDIAIAFRTSAAPHEMEYTSAWVQDTLTTGRWTFNAGVRYDLQQGANLASTVDANAAIPDVLPALDFGGNDAGYEWESLSPRGSATYALGADRRTLLRASYARFADQLDGADITRVNPTGTSGATLLFDDANGNNLFEPGEAFEVIAPFGFDPSDPFALETPSVNDPNMDPPVTDELVASIEHSILPELVVGFDVTYRKVSKILENRTFILEGDQKRLATRDDYVLDHTVTSDGVDVPHLPDGSSWSADFYRLRPGISLAGGSLLTNGDREREYLGASLSFTKRLSRNWMARGYVQYGEAEWTVPASFFAFDDPTDAGLVAAAQVDTDGELFIVQSAGSGPFADTLLQASWSANVNGMYQFGVDKPWGFNLAGNLFAREGYPLPYTYTEGVGDGRTIAASAVGNVDAFRADDVYVLDLRLEKDMRFTDNLSGIISLDAFNVGNQSFVMQRDRSLEAPTANFVNQTLAPRIYRLGFRLNWR